jgi:hypothetical protein
MVLVVALLLLAGLLGWMRRAPAGAVPPIAAGGAAVAPSAASAPASGAVRPAAAPGAPVAGEVGASSSAPPAFGTAGTAQASGHWDLCGLGRVPKPPGHAGPPPEHLLRDSYEVAVQQLAATLAAGGPRERRLAQLMGWRPMPSAGQPDADGPRDPVLAAWTMRLCQGRADCLPAAVQRWLAVEPDNLLPMLWSLDAKQPLDAAMLRRLAGATRLHTHSGQLAGTLVAAWPASQPRFVLRALIVEVAGIEAASAWPLGASALVRNCRTTDPALRLPCQQIARTLLQHSDSHLGVGLGLSVGRQAGLPTQVLDAARQESGELRASQVQAWEEHATEPGSCRHVDVVVAWVGEAAQYGEWHAMKRLRAQRAAMTTPQR